jgi:hypothetical protein
MPSVVRPASSACQRRREQITAGPTIAGLLSLALIVGVASDLEADPIADFYRGKVVHMFIGYGPGGGYDLYGRLVAEFLPKHLPGNPAILPQNMPGGGSFVAARYMAEVAPKDGTALGSLAQTLALDSAVNRSNTLDAGKFHYIGRVTSNIDVGAALPSAGITSFEDVRKRPYTIGASGGGSTTVLFPAALNAYGGARFKIVRGYKGTNDILLAMERGEVDIVGAYGLPGMLVSHPGWIDKARPRSFIKPRSSAIGYCRTCPHCRSLRSRMRAARSCARSRAPPRSAGRSSPPLECRGSGSRRCVGRSRR